MTLKHRRIKKLLIANRGEIAIRVERACRELGIRSVAVYSDADRTCLHVLMADEAYPLHGVTAAETYLAQDKIIEAAKKAGVDAIHPGYGFLSENPVFAERLRNEGIIFVGPDAQAIRTLGDKTAARKLAAKLGIPTAAGVPDPLNDETQALYFAEQIGFPVLLKAAAGGGGKGMRMVRSREEMSASLRTAKSEAKSAFGDDRVYMEKYIQHPKHVEIQILADQHGNTVYLGERECSIQRRHQKVIEESPSPIMNPEMRRAMGESAVRLAKEAGYTNAGTVEFLVDKDRQFYFLEVNTRLQVEHPVTESVTGIDLVMQQIAIAEGRELTMRQETIQPHGHSIQCRIYAEDPANDFFPSTGTLREYRLPQGPRVRVDNGFRPGDEISIYYDPLLAKVVTWADTRTEAIKSMERALKEFLVAGVETTIPFCLSVLSHQAFLDGSFTTHFVEDHFAPSLLGTADPAEESAAALAASIIWNRKTNFSTSGENHSPGKQRSNWKELRKETYRQ
ncbi:MAG: acetyl-CoA carboxylase biotin carboxylase subunit [Bacteroidetes bacterium]|nr:acetyl-CoA carboxylase biotin carboxylase subunit [Bacteroidota bacterium]